MAKPDLYWREISLMDVPRPKDEEFCQRVENEISKATEDATEIVRLVYGSWPLDDNPEPKPKPEPKPRRPYTFKKRAIVIRLGSRVKTFPEKKCVGCGTLHDELTDGCRKCYDRHKGRRRAARIKGVRYETPFPSRSLRPQIDEKALEIDVLIALSLGMSIREVATHVQDNAPWGYQNTREFIVSLREKYGASNNTALVAKAIRRNIIA